MQPRFFAGLPWPDDSFDSKDFYPLEPLFAEIDAQHQRQNQTLIECVSSSWIDSPVYKEEEKSEEPVKPTEEKLTIDPVQIKLSDRAQQLVAQSSRQALPEKALPALNAQMKIAMVRPKIVPPVSSVAREKAYESYTRIYNAETGVRAQIGFTGKVVTEAAIRKRHYMFVDNSQHLTSDEKTKIALHQNMLVVNGREIVRITKDGTYYDSASPVLFKRPSTYAVHVSSPKKRKCEDSAADTLRI